jgi:hypothetical protein
MADEAGDLVVGQGATEPAPAPAEVSHASLCGREFATIRRIEILKRNAKSRKTLLRHAFALNGSHEIYHDDPHSEHTPNPSPAQSTPESTVLTLQPPDKVLIEQWAHRSAAMVRCQPVFNTREEADAAGFDWVGQ